MSTQDNGNGHTETCSENGSMNNSKSKFLQECNANSDMEKVSFTIHNYESAPSKNTARNEEGKNKMYVNTNSLEYMDLSTPGRLGHGRSSHLEFIDASCFSSPALTQSLLGCDDEVSMSSVLRDLSFEKQEEKLNGCEVLSDDQGCKLSREGGVQDDEVSISSVLSDASPRRRKDSKEAKRSLDEGAKLLKTETPDGVCSRGEPLKESALEDKKIATIENLNKWGFLRQRIRLTQSNQTIRREEPKMESVHSLSFGAAVLKVLKDAKIEDDSQGGGENDETRFCKTVFSASGSRCPNNGTAGRYTLSRDRRESEILRTIGQEEANRWGSRPNIAAEENDEILPIFQLSPEHKQCKGKSEEDQIDKETRQTNQLSTSAECGEGHKEENNDFLNWEPAPTLRVPEILKNKHRTVVINIGGIDYRSKISNFSKFPASRLGKIFRAKTTDEILKLCDGYIPGAPPILFFDKNDQNFSAILDMYRMNQLHVCGQNCALVTQEDLAFWGIDELQMEPCCALKYYPHIVACQTEVEEERQEYEHLKKKQLTEYFGDNWYGRFRTRMWNFVEYPESSKPAQILAFFSLFMVCVSTVTFVIGTNYDEQETEMVFYFDNGTMTEVMRQEENPVKKVIDVVDNIAVYFFTVEYVARYIFSPRKSDFLWDKMNFIDLLAILPFFLGVVLKGLEDMQIIGKAGKIIRLVRIMRIMRIFKMVRHFAGLQSLVYTLQQAYKELGLLFILVAVAILLYTSLIFACEQEGKDAEHWSFYSCFWWGLMTLTTVGYNMTPVTFLGKLICGMCAITGIFILTLPIPIVVTSFASCYKNRLWRNQIANKKRIIDKDLRPGMGTEKRNMFADLAGQGGFYINKEPDSSEPHIVSLLTDSPTSALSLSPMVPRRKSSVSWERKSSLEEEQSPFLQVEQQGSARPNFLNLPQRFPQKYTEV